MTLTGAGACTIRMTTSSHAPDAVVARIVTRPDDDAGWLEEGSAAEALGRFRTVPPQEHYLDYENVLEMARTLVTRGADSDLLSHDTAVAMTQRGPRAELVEFEGVGHAPTFVAPVQRAAVTSFLFDTE